MSEAMKAVLAWIGVAIIAVLLSVAFRSQPEPPRYTLYATSDFAIKLDTKTGETWWLKEGEWVSVATKFPEGPKLPPNWMTPKP
jgi:hypothetical protein